MKARFSLWILTCAFALTCLPTPAAEFITLSARRRTETAKGSGHFKPVEEKVRWDARKTAVVVCDMWDKHWCKGASARVAEMAPIMNQVLKEARKRGALIVHAPSDTMNFYQDTPQRRRAQEASQATPPVPIASWCKLQPDREPPLPIDDSDGGCDDEPRCPSASPYPWTRQIATLEIAPEDAVSDKGQEVYNLLQTRGIDNVVVMGVHANMCVLGRSFAIRQMVKLGKNVVLVRDLTDTMYNSRMKPLVNHFRGNDLVIEHIEKYWCPSVTSADFTRRPPFRFAADPLAAVTAETSR